jgi:hypothetical protein
MPYPKPGRGVVHMGRVCSVCVHGERDEIDRLLVSGSSLGQIARQYPPLTTSALSRHHRRHVSAALAAMETARQAEQRASLLERIESVIRRAETMFTAAANEGRTAQALDVLRELRLQLELLGKATGELQQQPGLVVNLVASPEWLMVRDAVLSALLAYPDARAAVTGRLLELED